jgi:hypothetical protein
MSSTKTVYKTIEEWIANTIMPVGIETLRLLPDGVILGTAILASLSFCKSYGVLLFTMMELMMFQRVLATTVSSISPIGAGKESLTEVCEPGFNFPNSMRISLLETIGKPSAFPSPVMFFVSAILAYMIGCMKEFSREIKTLGGDLDTRTTIGVVLSSFFAFIVLAFRYSYGCESFGTLLVSLFLGGVIGLVLVYQNRALFGRDGVNILNLPMIQTAEERGKPMYVCAPANT